MDPKEPQGGSHVALARGQQQYTRPTLERVHHSNLIGI